MQSILQSEGNNRFIADEGTETGWRPIAHEDVENITAAKQGMVPIGQVQEFYDTDGHGASRHAGSQSIPIRLARGVTIHKLQGISLDRLIMTPGTRRMFGTTFTGFTRARGGFDSIILADNTTDDILVTDLNASPGDNLDLLRILARLEEMASATHSGFLQGALYLRSLQLEVQVAGSRSIGIRQSRPADRMRDSSAVRGQGTVRGSGRGAVRGSGRGAVRGRGRGAVRGRGRGQQ